MTDSTTVLRFSSEALNDSYSWFDLEKHGRYSLHEPGSPTPVLNTSPLNAARFAPKAACLPPRNLYHFGKDQVDEDSPCG